MTILYHCYLQNSNKRLTKNIQDSCIELHNSSVIRYGCFKRKHFVGCLGGEQIKSSMED